jgi:hypothetical protein
MIIVGISFSFCLAEIAGKLHSCQGHLASPPASLLTRLFTVGFYTRSLALVADAFHYVRDF